MNYGLPYMGSKSRICEWLMAYLPPADTFIDLFAGGCAVTHAAMISGKYNHVIANDVQGDVLELFHRAVTQGLSQEDWRPVPREEFELHKATDALIGLVWSFGNNRKNYIYGKDIEGLKLSAHAMLTGKTVQKRYSFWNGFIKKLSVYSGKQRLDIQSIESIMHIQSLLGLARIQSLLGLARIQSLLQISVFSYDACPYLPPRHLQWFTQIRRISALRSTPPAHSTTTVFTTGSAPSRTRSTFRSITCRTILSRLRRLVLIRLCLQLTTNRPSNIFFSMNDSRIHASNRPYFRPPPAIIYDTRSHTPRTVSVPGRFFRPSDRIL